MLLDIVHAEWPKLLPAVPQRAPGEKLAWDPTQTDIKVLRKHQINSMTTRSDGTMHMGAGYGKQSLPTAAR